MDHPRRHPRAIVPSGLALPLAALALAAPAAAFQFEYPQPYTLQLDHPLTPASYVTGDAVAVVLGHLNADAIPDACVLHGTEAFLIRSTDRRSQWRRLAGDYTGIARLPKGQAGERDAVVAVDANGLVRLVWDGSPGVETLVPTAVAGTDSWIGATQLQALETPGGSHEILALSAEGRTILRAEFVPGSGSVNPLPFLELTDVATALTGIDWTDSSDLEYAYAGNWGVAVCEPELCYEPEVVEACNRSLLVRIPVAGEFDRLGWIRAPSGTVDFLTVLRPDGNDDPPILLLGASIAQATLANLCEDDSPELVLFADTSPYAIGLRRDASKTFKDFSHPQFVLDLDRGHTRVGSFGNYAFPSGTGVLGGTGKAPVPAAMDLDGDSDDDLFAAGHAGGAARAMVFLGSLYDEESTDEPEVLRAWLPGYNATTYPATDEALLEFEVAERPSSGPASVATHVRYTVWVQAENATCMDLASEQSLLFDVTPSGIPQYPGLLLPDLASLGNGWIHIESSFLRFENGTMVQAFPAYHEKLALSWFTGGEPLVFLAGTAGNWAPPYLAGGDGGVGGTSGRPPSTPPSGGGG